MAMHKGKHLRSIEKTWVLKLHDFFKREMQEGVMLLDKPADRVAEAIGINRSTVYRICKEQKEKGNVSSPTKRGKMEHSGSLEEYTDNFQGVIRRRIHRFYTDKTFPTMSLLHAALVHEVNYPFSKTSLYKTVRKMGFAYKTMNRKKCLYEQNRILTARVNYLKQIQGFRERNRPIVYLDETSLHQHHTLEKCWTDYDGKGGLRIPSGKGKSLIILHAGGEMGWTPEAELVFVGKKDTGDYHNEMNISHFMEWFEHKLLPNCPPQSVIVLDNARYHNAVVEKIPTKSSRKQDMIDWLAKHKILHEPKMLKVELFDLIKRSNPISVYQTDVLAAKFGCDCLRLPVGHCELNPIELVWAQVKRHAAQHNTGIAGFTMENIKRLCREGLANVTVEKWANCVKHVREKVEKHYRTIHGVLDDVVEQMVIEVGPESEDSSSSSETESSKDED